MTLWTRWFRSRGKVKKKKIQVPFPYVGYRHVRDHAFGPRRPPSTRSGSSRRAVYLRAIFSQPLSVSHLLTLFSFRVRNEAPIKMKRRSNDRNPNEGKGIAAHGNAAANEKRGETWQDYPSSSRQNEPMSYTYLRARKRTRATFASIFNNEQPGKAATRRRTDRPISTYRQTKQTSTDDGRE